MIGASAIERLRRAYGSGNRTIWRGLAAESLKLLGLKKNTVIAATKSGASLPGEFDALESAQQ